MKVEISLTESEQKLLTKWLVYSSIPCRLPKGLRDSIDELLTNIARQSYSQRIESSLTKEINNETSR